MSLNFPNVSRSYEAKRNRVRFWGYDSALEITFFVDSGLLARLCPDCGDGEAGLLKAFDTMIERIHDAARKAYKGNRERSDIFVLTEAQF
ncbi:MAG: DUF1488 domain-containing protein [Alphaproteobacteria bacterium]|jgi:hypothetical protein|nr:hypothetical protein [Magnetovibrio sp.]HBT44451.1 DUF1488 domain-containing protein [Rhodospirillaceae bacterium]HCS70395.1 DUF1488 domain-containing protein [Rhodospirillaceae bacterium]|tara:strand:- start:10720 stop:10989 length:270 start_codon:yes stop_codon:yes gene_type:complete